MEETSSFMLFKFTRCTFTIMEVENPVSNFLLPSLLEIFVNQKNITCSVSNFLMAK